MTAVTTQSNKVALNEDNQALLGLPYGKRWTNFLANPICIYLYVYVFICVCIMHIHIIHTYYVYAHTHAHIYVHIQVSIKSKETTTLRQKFLHCLSFELFSESGFVGLKQQDRRWGLWNIGSGGDRRVLLVKLQLLQCREKQL